MAFIDPQDYWEQFAAHIRELDERAISDIVLDADFLVDNVDECPQCGADLNDIFGHAAYHSSLFTRFYVWPEIIYEDVLDAEYLDA